MKAYAVRRDRADVMAVAAITFLTLGRYLNLRTFALPGVGVREGLLQEIAREAFLPQRAAPVQRRSAPVARGHAQFCAADWI